MVAFMFHCRTTEVTKMFMKMFVTLLIIKNVYFHLSSKVKDIMSAQPPSTIYHGVLQAQKPKTTLLCCKRVGVISGDIATHMKIWKMVHFQMDRRVPLESALMPRALKLFNLFVALKTRNKVALLLLNSSPKE